MRARGGPARIAGSVGSVGEFRAQTPSEMVCLAEADPDVSPSSDSELGPGPLAGGSRPCRSSSQAQTSTTVRCRGDRFQQVSESAGLGRDVGATVNVMYGIQTLQLSYESLNSNSSESAGLGRDVGAAASLAVACWATMTGSAAHRHSPPSYQAPTMSGAQASNSDAGGRRCPRPRLTRTRRLQSRVRLGVRRLAPRSAADGLRCGSGCLSKPVR